MTEDHYATLGVAPRSEAAAIRAAYLALMRRYHPDKNDSPAAAERARAVTAAFAVLGDSEKRLHYDWDRRRAAEAAADARRWRSGKMPRVLIAAAVMLLLLVPILLMRPSATVRAPAVEPIAAVAAVPGEPVKNVEERPIATPRTAMAPFMVPRSNAVVGPVTTPSRAAERRPNVEDVPPVPVPAPRVPLAPRPPRLARGDVAPIKSLASAHARCRLVKPGAEAAICEDDNLAALDSNAVTFYNQSLSFGNAAKRAALLGARDSFLIRREECRSDACLRNVHLTHMREISAIVENRPAEPPR